MDELAAGAGRLFLTIFTTSIGIFVFLICLILKLTEVWSNVSWFWVCFPIIAGAALGIILCTISIIRYSNK